MRESEAIARLKRDDIRGLEGLVRVYGVQAVRAAYLVCRDRALAEDVAQAAFLRAYERIGQYDSSRPFGPWFLRSVVNDARKAAMRRERDLPLEATGCEENEPPAPDVSPDNLIIEGETSEAIWEALGKLTAGQRSAIVLRYYLDLSESEMSERLAVPPGTVKSRLHAARGRLRRLLPAWLVPEGQTQEKEDKSYL